MSHEATELAWRIAEPCHGVRLVLLSLADHHNAKTGLCCPSVARLVECTRLERKAVLRAIAELEQLGLIGTQRKKGCGSRYTLRFLDQSENGAGDKTGPVTKRVSTSPKTGWDRSQNVTRNHERTGKEPIKVCSKTSLEAEEHRSAGTSRSGSQNCVVVSPVLRERPSNVTFNDRDRWNQLLQTILAEISQLTKLPAHHREPDHQEKLVELRHRASELKYWLDGKGAQ
ncbi:MAG: hypothetical protein RIS79_1651 [Verrucomicrobiota bacterium]